MGAGMKTCAVCRIRKPLDGFHRSKAAHDGRVATCTECRKDQRLAWVARIPRGKHGYAAYTAGCRCAKCKTAKAEYLRERRRTAYLADGDARLAVLVTHGRAGYEERGCRCGVCVGARRKMWREDSARRSAKQKAGAA